MLRCERIHLKDFYPHLAENGRDPFVDIYLPYNMREMKRQDDKRPSMVICPGGGYGGCSEREWEPLALKVMAMGFNAFVIRYSTAPHRYPTQLIEVAALYDLINKNANDWNCDVEKISIMGFSAGGHLAAHYSNAYNLPKIKELYGATYRPFSSVLCYAVISTDPDIANRGTFVNLLGYFPEGEEGDKYSCEKLVTEDTPPAFIWHTTTDQCVHVANSLRYAEALSKNKVLFDLHIYPYGVHGLATADSLTLDMDGIDTTAYKKIADVHDWLKELQKWFHLI